MAWVFEQSEATLGARLVLLAIAGHADREGRNSWASVKSLSEEARLSVRQTQYALRKLEELGEIAKTGMSQRRTHVYDLMKMGAESAPPRVQNPQGGGAIHDTKRVHPTAPEPKTEPSKALERERDPAFDALAVATGHDLKALSRSTARSIGVMLADIAEAESSRHEGQPVTRQFLGAEIEYRAERYRRLHPDWELTPASLAKHWATLGAKPVRIDGHAAHPRPPLSDGGVSVEESERIGAETLADWRKGKSKVVEREGS